MSSKGSTICLVPKNCSQVVQIRDKTPQLLELFSEMAKVLNPSDLANFPGLELNSRFVHKHLFKHWNGERFNHAWVHQKGLTIKVRDIDTKTDHGVTFQKCFNVDRYFLQGGWFGNFVHRRGSTCWCSNWHALGYKDENYLSLCFKGYFRVSREFKCCSKCHSRDFGRKTQP